MIPEFLHRFFWEYDPEEIDIHKHSDLIINRIMERGTWKAMFWLRSTYSQKMLSDFLYRRGSKILPFRELNYWALICDVPEETRQSWIRSRRQNQDVWQARSVS